jgi:flagellar motor switch protein FliM
MHHTHLEVTAVLGNATVKLGQVMDLKPGDVLVLDQHRDDQSAAWIAGRLRLLGRAGRSGKKNALLVDRVIPAGKNPLDREGPSHG